MAEPAATLDPDVRAFLDASRRATLATVAPDGRPRLVPVCFAVVDGSTRDHVPRIYTPLDAKPKRSSDPRRLARVRDVIERPEVTLLVDRWDEDWSRLGWVRVDGDGDLVEPPAGEHGAAVAALLARYPQYATHGLDARPMIRIAIRRVRWWGDLRT